MFRKHLLINILGTFLLGMFLTNCTPIEERVVNKKVLGIYDELWDTLYNEYVNFAYYDNEDTYSDYYRELKHANKDSLSEVQDCIREFTQAMGDPQFRLKTSVASFEYELPDWDQYAMGWMIPCQNDCYTMEQIGNNYFNCIFFLLTSQATGKQYLFFHPSNMNIKGVSFVRDEMDENMRLFREKNLDGVVVDLRYNSRMTQEHMMDVLNYFLPNNEDVVYYTQRRQSPKKLRKLTDKEPYYLAGLGLFDTLPCCVLFERNTFGCANIMAYVLSELPNVTTFSMSETGGGGAFCKEVMLAWNEEAGGYMLAADVPYILLSNDSVTFNHPLRPDVQVPYSPTKYVYYEVDNLILAALQSME